VTSVRCDAVDFDTQVSCFSETRWVSSCPNCGKEVAGDFPFCPFCATPLRKGAAAPRREERKVVSVLFCDLVGFTAASDHADPEDVRARLVPYHAQLQQVIGGYGGTVEKFVGDAVMAVFGAPVAHEDDAERAVRAGLRILEAIEELNRDDEKLHLQVRVGINTGEAVVALDAHPERGEGFVTGDVVNTASRLQGVAPINAVAVSEPTYRQTERVFIFDRLDPVQVKGKSEPLRVWQPVAARARFGADVIRTSATRLVGREFERQQLIATFERAASQRSCQLVTVVGEPGVGKTRLCTELLQYIERRSELVRWRQGRCLPYGEGIVFWALGEIVKAECGILESDSPEVALAKLEQAIPEGEADRAWLTARLAPLVGAGGEPAPHEESFTAWRRFLEGLAVQHPTVLVVDDLHWADEPMLAFLEHLADWSAGVPLLLLCTARPELHERHPTWAASLRNAQTINLAPLSDEDTTTLIALLLKRHVLPAATQRALLDRAGGNPLYTEEFVRLLSDRDLLAGPLEELHLPDSLQALIAARLDTLSAERKNLLQDAAVIGKVFWAGAVASMGERDPRDVELALHELARKELVRPARGSSMQGEREYGFWHLLVRDVCYAQIPRSSRAARHRAAAVWIERHAGERVDDLSDVLAHHYTLALELSRAAGQEQDIPELEATARRYLALAGERALPIDVASAEASFARALALAPESHAERAELLERWAFAAHLLGRVAEARAALEEALRLHRDAGTTVAAARTMTSLSKMLRMAGDPGSRALVAEAVALLEAEDPGTELVNSYAELASGKAIDSMFADGIAAAEQALRLASALGLSEPARALGVRGAARAFQGDDQGMADMRRALALAVERGLGRDAATLFNNLALAIWQYEGPPAALAACEEGIDFCERRGMSGLATWTVAQRLTFVAASGQADRALADVESAAAGAEVAGISTLIEVRSVELRLRSRRGERAGLAAADNMVATARESGEPELIAMGFAAAVEVMVASGNTQRATALLEELERTGSTRADPYYAASLPGLVRCALELAQPALVAGLVAGVEPRTPLQQHALATCSAALAEAAGDHASASTAYAVAAARWRTFGDRPELGFALLGQGRCLVAAGSSEADSPLREARELFSSMGYAPALAVTDELLRRQGAQTS
jgi:class 3 adenylate cyclase/tetratricopeptide (TPR) repeat protein